MVEVPQLIVLVRLHQVLVQALLAVAGVALLAVVAAALKAVVREALVVEVEKAVEVLEKAVVEEKVQVGQEKVHAEDPVVKARVVVEKDAVAF